MYILRFENKPENCWHCKINRGCGLIHDYDNCPIVEENKSIDVKFKTVHKDAKIPTKSKENDTCYDVFAIKDDIVYGGQNKKIPTGICIEPPPGYAAELKPRSSTSIASILVFPNELDNGYRGELGIQIINLGRDIFIINKGDRIAQVKFKRVIDANFIQVDELSKTDRGNDGFGSTGR